MSKSNNKEKLKPTFSVVGAGRLGTALGIAMSSGGYRPEAVVTRHPVRARKAAALVGGATTALSAAQLHLLPPSRILIIATPDDEIGQTAQALADFHLNRVRRRIVLHTSGALSSEILAPLAKVGFQVGSLHPLVSVSEPGTGAASLLGAFFCIEGDVGAARVARAIVGELKGGCFSIPARYKPLYHAAAVMASGHVVSLFDLAAAMLEQCGLDRREARRVLQPLLQSTVTNLSMANPAGAMTGPFARGDLATVQRHLSALDESGLSVALDVYRVLGGHALNLKKKHGVDQQILDRVRRELESSPHLRK